MTDLPDGLRDDPFAYTVTKNGQVRVSRGGRVVATIAGRQAQSLIGRLGASDDADQHLLARATGQYRMGNERR